jgi:hypothetical protein
VNLAYAMDRGDARFGRDVPGSTSVRAQLAPSLFVCSPITAATSIRGPTGSPVRARMIHAPLASRCTPNIGGSSSIRFQYITSRSLRLASSPMHAEQILEQISFEPGTCRVEARWVGAPSVTRHRWRVRTRKASTSCRPARSAPLRLDAHRHGKPDAPALVYVVILLLGHRQRASVRLIATSPEGLFR